MPVSEVQLKEHKLKCLEIHEQFNKGVFEFNRWGEYKYQADNDSGFGKEH